MMIEIMDSHAIDSANHDNFLMMSSQPTYLLVSLDRAECQCTRDAHVNSMFPYHKFAHNFCINV